MFKNNKMAPRGVRQQWWLRVFNCKVEAYAMKREVDYNKIFSLVVKMTTINLEYFGCGRFVYGTMKCQENIPACTPRRHLAVATATSNKKSWGVNR